MKPFLYQQREYSTENEFQSLLIKVVTALGVLTERILPLSAASPK